MGNLRVFAENAERYDRWYEKHRDVFNAELAAIREITPAFERGLEIGVGTGRFAAALGIAFGIDPAPEMIEMAGTRGVESTLGVAERLPFSARSFDFVLMTTTICFLDDIQQAFAEIHRVLHTDGCFIAAFIDKNSHLGLEYQKRTESGDSPFYANAEFVSPDEIAAKLANVGFEIAEIRQTLFPSGKSPLEPLPGHGQAAFVVMKAVK